MVVNRAARRAFDRLPMARIIICRYYHDAGMRCFTLKSAELEQDSRHLDEDNWIFIPFDNISIFAVKFVNDETAPRCPRGYTEFGWDRYSRERTATARSPLHRSGHDFNRSIVNFQVLPCSERGGEIIVRTANHDLWSLSILSTLAT